MEKRNFLNKLIDEVKNTINVTLLNIAMHVPFIHVKRLLYRLRGTKLGEHVDIANGVYIDEAYPELVSIGDNVDLGPWVMILTHDSSPHCINPEIKIRIKEVIIGDTVYIGAGAIILPGVKIGKRAIVGAGAVVTKDVPDGAVVVGVPARIIRQT